MHLDILHRNRSPLVPGGFGVLLGIIAGQFIIADHMITFVSSTLSSGLLLGEL